MVARGGLGRGVEAALPGAARRTPAGHPADAGGGTGAAADEVVIALDPGMAFGTGLHPTTRLCLAGIERLGGRGRLSAGASSTSAVGSGILAIAAVKLGAARALGVDIDPIAVEATEPNAAPQPRRAAGSRARRARSRRGERRRSTWSSRT